MVFAIMMSVFEEDVKNILVTLIEGRHQALAAAEAAATQAERFPLYKTAAGGNRRLCDTCAQEMGAEKKTSDGGKRRAVKVCQHCGKAAA